MSVVGAGGSEMFTVSARAQRGGKTGVWALMSYVKFRGQLGPLCQALLRCLSKTEEPRVGPLPPTTPSDRHIKGPDDRRYVSLLHRLTCRCATCGDRNQHTSHSRWARFMSDFVRPIQITTPTDTALPLGRVSTTGRRGAGERLSEVELLTHSTHPNTTPSQLVKDPNPMRDPHIT